MNRKRKTTGKCGEPEGRYSNYFEVGHSASDFVLNFSQNHESVEELLVHTRIITAPKHAMEFLEILGRSIETHDRSSEVIREQSQVQDDKEK